MKISISKEWMKSNKLLHSSTYELDILNKFKEHSEYILKKKDKLVIIKIIKRNSTLYFINISKIEIN